jgi:hypothetical protein
VTDTQNIEEPTWPEHVKFEPPYADEDPWNYASRIHDLAVEACRDIEEIRERREAEPEKEGEPVAALA